MMTWAPDRRGIGMGIHWLALVVACVLFSGCERGDAWTTANALASGDAVLATALASDPFTEDGRAGMIAHAWSVAAQTPKKQGLTLGARLPATASGAIEAGLATAGEAKSGARGDFVVALRHAGLRDAPLVIQQGHAEYRDVATSTDLLASASDAKVEWFYLLRDAGAPARFTLDVVLPRGLPRATMKRDGSLAFLDARGKTRLALAKPYAVDARGTRRDATLAWDAKRARLDLTLDPHGLAYPVLIDPAVAYPLWEEVDFGGSKIPAASGSTLAYDIARGKTVLFGGYGGTGGGTALDATWEWDGTTWTESTVATSPPPRFSATMVYDSARAKTVLFGGIEGGFGGYSLDDTWEWDGTTWTLRLVTNPPPNRFGAAMAYDSTRGKTVLFGGYGDDGTTYLNDTWEWDGTQWTLRTVATSPSARGNPAMTYDSKIKKCVLFGGYNGPTDGNAPPSAYLGDTWEWDGTTWTSVATGAQPGRSNAMMAYDVARSESVLFAGNGSASDGFDVDDTRVFDGTTWSAKAVANPPSSRSGAGIAYDSARQRTVLFGGGKDDGTNLKDTWEWDGTSWTARSVGDAPAARNGAAMAYDSTRAQNVLFGGFGNDNELNDTWEWSGTGWAARSPANAPSVRGGSAMAYDIARKTIVLFGGSGSTYFQDTWEWDGTNWTKLTPAASPSAREQMSMVYDSRNAKTVLFGGYGKSAPNYLQDTWLWNGTTWVSPTITGSLPPVRVLASMAYDSVRGRTVLFGGQDKNGNLGDTWEWDGTSWTSPSLGVAPPLRAGAAMAYDSTIEKTILFGGVDDENVSLDDTWEWDGTTWNSPSTLAPTSRYGHTMTFDPNHGVLLFGGVVADGSNDTWLFVTVGASCTTTATCDSGSCVDGVCCAESACGACQSCAIPGSEGQCTNVTAGTVPTTGDANACAAPNVCTASGACAAPQGSACAESADCFTGFCVDGVCCDSACGDDCQACSTARGLSENGICALAPEGIAGRAACGAGLVCNGKGAVCPTTCADDLSCAAGFYCGPSGTCIAQKQQGQSCVDLAGADCLTNHCRECAAVGAASIGQCVDGVCCDTPCDGSCDVCNASGSVGTCSNAPRGAAGAPSCSPYVCTGAASSCGDSCAGDVDCSAQSYCDVTTHTCQGTAALGDPCARDDACASGACVGSICCRSHCGAASSDGGASVCGEGTCSSATSYACQLPAGIQCRAESCTGGTHTFVATCDGKGNCGAVESQACDPFVCGATTCKSACAADADCVVGATCNAMTSKCEYGASCSSDNTSVIANNGVSTPCAPYFCAANMCSRSCASVADCQKGFVCSPSGACVAGASGGTTSGGCSCRVGAARTSGDPRSALGLVLFAFVLGRRRGRTAAPTTSRA